ncbi:AfsR family transcriptional regulator [Streptomyces populi]|uniref:AfsR family transcriptional regulator n=1 Tax=Streptomyces populi TaxID=2058924 RepID=A0A2I0STC0_9ACTN|nr:BTAD domain-containing putative transcriptional regulator [Streptomyces populi]PKT73176.1 AfsR family transcriptional regulator [Streptomyces populi]
MEFRLLGMVSVDTLEGPLSLGPAKRRSLLAALLLSVNTPVPVTRLTDCLWDDAPPLHARSVIQGHVSRIRALLADGDAAAYGVELATLGDAYALRSPETLLDSHRFEELLALAREQRDARDAVAMLKDALSLWQGPALAGTFPGPALQAAAHSLEESRVAAVEQLARAHTTLGEHDQAAAVLRTVAAAHPMREPLAASLMAALYRAGRQSEALDWFHRTRRLLVDELGVDPGSELTQVHALILRGDPLPQDGPDTPADPVAAPPPEHPGPTGSSDGRASDGSSLPAPELRTGDAVPAPARSGPVALPPLVDLSYPKDLLPRAPRGFHGREAELAALTRAAAAEGPICLVTGLPGVGKTALAVQWAHRNADMFPDGLLFADLRGFSDTGEPALTEVLREFLPALGVPPRRVPESASAAAALFRSLTHRRRLLVVLDNVRDSATVRALLPGGADCVTLVTSRHRLDGLVASEAASAVPLDSLEPQDGTELLAGVLGKDRILAEPEAARRLTELCGGLPLALRVTAARLAGRPQRTLAELADELADERSRLTYLDVDDTSVSAALRLTVQQLPPDALHQFTRLGHHPGSHFDPFTAAALAGTTPRAAAAALERLAAAHLVTETAAGRWELHDLVRLYARTLDPGSGREALTGVLDHYIATALAAADTAQPGGEPCFTLPDGFRRPAAVRDFTDRASAMHWLATEREDLALAVVAARAAGLDDRAWRIILLQWPQVVWRVRDNWVPLLNIALECARAQGDPYAQSRVLTLLGWVLSEEGRPAEALALLELSPPLARQAGDRLGEATALINLAVVEAAQGDLETALESCARAIVLAREESDAHTEMLALQHLARIQLTAGRPREALRSARTALDLGPEHEEAARRALLLTVSGEARLALGADDEAVLLLDQAAEEAERAGYDEGAVRALATLLRVRPGEGYRKRYEEAVRRISDDG